MSSSDARMFDALAERVALLEAGYGRLDRGWAEAIARLEEKMAALGEAVLGKDVSGELYGAERDHGADREARAALLAKRRDRG
jgi:hypothetical protein